MTYRLQRIEVPDEPTESLAGALRQFFADNPAITLLDVSVRIEERGGLNKALAWVSYDTDGTQTYDAVEFIGPDTASQAAVFFASDGARNVARVFITTRFGQQHVGKRLLVIYEDRYASTRAQAGWLVGGTAAEGIASTATGQALQPSGDALGADRLSVLNVGGGPWPAASQAPVIGSPADDPVVVAPGCEPAGSANLGILPPTPTPVACSGQGPSFPPPPPPPPNGNCCLDVTYECACIDDVARWQLTAAACVTNANCEPQAESCNGNTATMQVQDACLCGEPVPDPLPEPACDPKCCPDPPPEPDCCLSAQFDCLCDTEDSQGFTFAYWSLTSISCAANGTCAQTYQYDEIDTDNDGRVDRVAYVEQGGCDCGDTGAADSVLLAQLKANKPLLFNDANPPEPSVAPTATPECCPTGCCLELRYVCQETSGGGSAWQFLDATCLDSDDCSSSGDTPEAPVRDCGVSGTGQVATITLRDGCDCEDRGSVSQAVAEAALPGEPAGCTPSCATDFGSCCVEALYECQDIGSVSTWVFQSAACLPDQDCTSSGDDPETVVRVCSDTEARVSLRGGCDCLDQGTLAEAQFAAILPGEPAGCTPSCVAAFPCGDAPAPAPPVRDTVQDTFDPLQGGFQVAAYGSNADLPASISNYSVTAGVRITAAQFAELQASSFTNEVWLMVIFDCLYAPSFASSIQITGPGDWSTPAAPTQAGPFTPLTCSINTVYVYLADGESGNPGDAIVLDNDLSSGIEFCVTEYWDEP